MSVKLLFKEIQRRQSVGSHNVETRASQFITFIQPFVNRALSPLSIYLSPINARDQFSDYQLRPLFPAFFPSGIFQTIRRRLFLNSTSAPLRQPHLSVSTLSFDSSGIEVSRVEQLLPIVTSLSLSHIGMVSFFILFSFPRYSITYFLISLTESNDQITV